MYGQEGKFSAALNFLIGINERKTMRVNYKGNKMRKEAARRQEQEAKRMKRLGRHSDHPQVPPAEEDPPVEGTNFTGT